MKIEYARTIPLLKIFLKIGLRRLKTTGNEQWFNDPFNKSKRAYLSVNTTENTWLNSTTGAGGGTIEFVAWYLQMSEENHSQADCLRWLKNMLHEPVKIDLSAFPDYTAADAHYRWRGTLPLSNFMLLRYLENRQISPQLASHYVREVRIADTAGKKIFRAIGLRNEDGGYAIRNCFRKAQVAPATITFIRGIVPKPGGIHIFRDIFDFLSILALLRYKRLSEDSIIINAYSCLNDVMPYIANYGYSTVKTWLPNDSLGKLATKQLALQFSAEEGLRHIPMNKAYSTYLCPNEWLIASRK